MRKAFCMLLLAGLVTAVLPHRAEALPLLWEANWGTDLNVADDVEFPITLGPSFPLFGTTYTEAFLSDNGFISFGGTNGDGCCEGDVGWFLGAPGDSARSPRIAPTWIDLWGTGSADLYLNTSLTDRNVITWASRRAQDTGANVVQLQLLDSGVIIMGFATFQKDNARGVGSILVGVTPAKGVLDPGSTNLFAGAINTGTEPTAYMMINANHDNQPFNYNDFNLVWTPNGTGGWEIAAFSSEVPEPGSFALLGFGVTILAAVSRKRLVQTP